VINAIIQAAQEDQLWEDMLPVVACFLNKRNVMSQIYQLCDKLKSFKVLWKPQIECDLWTDMLVVVNYMQNEAREAVATAIAQINEEVLHHIAYASLLRSQWEVTFDIVRRMPSEKQQCKEILNTICSNSIKKLINI
jgi:hypothetical protein